VIRVLWPFAGRLGSERCSSLPLVSLAFSGRVFFFSFVTRDSFLVVRVTNKKKTQTRRTQTQMPPRKRAKDPKEDDDERETTEQEKKTTVAERKNISKELSTRLKQKLEVESCPFPQVLSTKRRRTCSSSCMPPKPCRRIGRWRSVMLLPARRRELEPCVTYRVSPCTLGARSVRSLRVMVGTPQTRTTITMRLAPGGEEGPSGTSEDSHGKDATPDERRT